MPCDCGGVAESNNDVNMDESAVTVLESAGLTMVCASIDGVTEIERGFTGNFQIIADEDVTSETQNFYDNYNPALLLLHCISLLCIVS